MNRFYTIHGRHARKPRKRSGPRQRPPKLAAADCADYADGPRSQNWTDWRLISAGHPRHPRHPRNPRLKYLDIRLMCEKDDVQQWGSEMTVVVSKKAGFLLAGATVVGVI